MNNSASFLAAHGILFPFSFSSPFFNSTYPILSRSIDGFEMNEEACFWVVVEFFKEGMWKRRRRHSLLLTQKCQSDSLRQRTPPTFARLNHTSSPPPNNCFWSGHDNLWCPRGTYSRHLWKFGTEPAEQSLLDGSCHLLFLPKTRVFNVCSLNSVKNYSLLFLISISTLYHKNLPPFTHNIIIFFRVVWRKNVVIHWERG